MKVERPCQVPDRQLNREHAEALDGAVRRQMEAVSTWQRVCFGKWVGKRRDWFFEQVKDRPVGGIPKWLRQSFELVPGSVGEPKDPITH
jgi:hypothetical protein